jgi:hypothetical protein
MKSDTQRGAVSTASGSNVFLTIVDRFRHRRKKKKKREGIGKKEWHEKEIN